MRKSKGASVPADRIIEYIVTAFDDVDVVQTRNGTFFSCDAATHWPNFATLVTSDEYDQVSDLSRPEVFRLNIGVNRTTFESLFPVKAAHAFTALDNPAHDFTALDQLMPHPVYGRQHWVCVLNPSEATFEQVVKPLLAEAYDRVAAQSRTRRGGPR